MGKQSKSIVFGKQCDLCNEPPVVGLIDFSKKADHIAVCEDHLKEFCISTLKKINNPAGV